MALTPRTAAASRDLALNAAFDVLNGGRLHIRDGVQPTDADTALGTQVLLADLALAATAFAAASAGSKAAGAITSDAAADATGTASWGSLVTGALVRKLDFSVGTTGANLNLNSVAVSSGATVACSAFTITQAV